MEAHPWAATLASFLLQPLQHLSQLQRKSRSLKKPLDSSLGHFRTSMWPPLAALPAIFLVQGIFLNHFAEDVQGPPHPIHQHNNNGRVPVLHIQKIVVGQALFLTVSLQPPQEGFSLSFLLSFLLSCPTLEVSRGAFLLFLLLLVLLLSFLMAAAMFLFMR